MDGVLALQMFIEIDGQVASVELGCGKRLTQWSPSLVHQVFQ